MRDVPGKEDQVRQRPPAMLEVCCRRTRLLIRPPPGPFFVGSDHLHPWRICLTCSLPSFDPASLLILEKLNEVSQKIDSIGSPAGVSRPPQAQPPPAEISPGNATSHTPPAAHLDSIDTVDCLEVLAPFASLDYVLTWPVFGGRWPQDLLSREVYNRSFGSGRSSSDDSSMPTRGHQRQGISEEDVPDLIDRYLHFVYPKNPIFYTREIREQARRIAEDGFDWDATSCLIVSTSSYNLDPHS
jgi:hypothetical protein